MNFGFICGVVLAIVLKNSHPSLVEITIKNESEFLINRVVIHEHELDNTYSIGNVELDESRRIYLYAKGEIGSNSILVFENDDLLSTGGYAETGYKDSYVIKNDTMIYKPMFAY